MCHGSAVVRWDSFIRTQYSNWILAKYRAAGDSFRKPQLQPSWGPPSPQPFTPAAAGGLSSKLFIIFWWFIAANFELGVISLKLDAHTKRTNERTHWEREAKRERDTLYREWRFFRKKPKQRNWNTFYENISYNLQKLRPAKTWLNNQGSINEGSSKWIICNYCKG